MADTETTLMGFDRTKFIAFGVTGLVWLLGLSVVVFYSVPIFVLGMALYFGLFTLAIASKSWHTPVALVAAWVMAVVGMSAIQLQADNLPGAAVFLGMVIGSFLFGGWVFTSLLLYVLIDPDRHHAAETTSPHHHGEHHR